MSCGGTEDLRRAITEAPWDELDEGPTTAADVPTVGTAGLASPRQRARGGNRGHRRQKRTGVCRRPVALPGGSCFIDRPSNVDRRSSCGRFRARHVLDRQGSSALRSTRRAQPAGGSSGFVRSARRSLSTRATKSAR